MGLGKNQAITQRNKHVDIQYHYVRDVAALGKSEFLYFPTEDMVADPLTKPLDRVKFENLVNVWALIARSLQSRGSVDSSVDLGRRETGPYHLWQELHWTDLHV